METPRNNGQMASEVDLEMQHCNGPQTAPEVKTAPEVDSQMVHSDDCNKSPSVSDHYYTYTPSPERPTKRAQRQAWMERHLPGRPTKRSRLQAEAAAAGPSGCNKAESLRDLLGAGGRYRPPRAGAAVGAGAALRLPLAAAVESSTEVQASG